MEQEIIEYLKTKYSPRAIVLAGSRASGSNSNKSDWDIFVFSEEMQPDGFFEWQGELLDITVHIWPKPADWVFTFPYGPVWPVKVLFDETGGEFAKILERTKTIYDQGPLVAYPIPCADRLVKLDRWKMKIEQYSGNQEVQFYYAGYIYEFLIRVWFEQQNLWPRPPAQALPYIAEKDSDYAKMLSDFTKTSGDDLARLTGIMVERLKNINLKLTYGNF